MLPSEIQNSPQTCLWEFFYCLETSPPSRLPLHDKSLSLTLLSLFHQSTSVSFRLFFCSFLTSLRFCGTGEKAFLWIRPLLKAMLWLVWSSLLDCFTYHSCVHWSSTFNFVQKLFLYITTWLTKGQAFGLSWLSACLFQLSLIISNF